MDEKTSGKKSEKARLHVTGMTCTTCARTIGKGLSETHGVKRANVNFASEEASLEYDPNKVNLAKIKDTISATGLRGSHQEIHFPGERHDLCFLRRPRRKCFVRCARGGFSQRQSSF